ncbi:MAG TPA: prepilin-type N-terminal cleavage/methylation domain-containing protein [Verrucomicrobiae bacterium]|jgi:prepilin-type N-terminal cleavage/methylation domain-containing protein|nr:prepilin-type N-terminal cleavage/methylation domain-containing protein [Verrucomicrobiae bacterium]
MPSRKNNGFSLLELMITVSLGLVMAGVTFIYLTPSMNSSHMNSAYETTLMALRNTRNLAITQGHQYQVNFNPGGFPPGTIQVEYQPPIVPPAVAAAPLQQVNTYTLPLDVSFALPATPPANAPDSPPPLVTGGTAIDFESTPAGVPLACQCVVFMPDGSARDSLGNYNSGIVYLTRVGDTVYNSRAVSVWGASGRIRGWTIGMVGGAKEWVQQ